MTTQKKSIMWFRQDFRLYDNPALKQACEKGELFPIFILDKKAGVLESPGAASKIALHLVIEAFQKEIGPINLYVGDPVECISQLCEQHDIDGVFWNQSFEPYQSGVENRLIAALEKKKMLFERFNGNYLWDPESILKDDGSYYRVFGAYKRKALQTAFRLPYKKVEYPAVFVDNKALSLKECALIPNVKWAKDLACQQKFGQNEAMDKLGKFVKTKLKGYAQGRDFPDENQVSGLSSHLHFGEISPHFIFYATSKKAPLETEADIESFFSELIWREFSTYLLYHFKELVSQPFQKAFSHFPFKANTHFLTAWQKGQTGIPLVDAGMRELWQTGLMHNRVRMIVASFLVKNCLQHWHVGRDWFWDCLLDADLANNSASWQWVAGCGVDAAPYFRIFNPVSQAQKFDPKGEYIRRFIPELKALPLPYLYKPWEAPLKVLETCRITLGKDYPKPIVDLKLSRAQALEAYQLLKDL